VGADEWINMLRKKENIMKIIEFPVKGVTVTIPKQVVYKNVYVEKKPDPPANDPIYQAGNIITGVINLAFFVLDVGNNKKYVDDLDPPAKLRIRYDSSVVSAANRKKKILAWWDKNNQIWVDLKSTNTSSTSKNWKGYGDVETKGWANDPPVGWGC
jgi:hypothetical protein